MQEDVRWLQRLDNYGKALSTLNNAASLWEERGLSDLEKQGLIQSFEFCFELAWKVMADYFLDQGNPTIRGSRDAFREAFKFELIEDGEL